MKPHAPACSENAPSARGITFDISVFDGLWDGIESVLPDRSLGCTFHVFIPPDVMATLRARYMRVIGHGTGEIDEGSALLALDKSGR
jgi:hypothetical protein